ncbi:MAG: hypothetical protein AMK73_10135, partial [Planctomycetes bacterium SM23_32]
MAAGATIETTATALTVDDATGSIASLVDKATGRDFVAGARPAPLYELTFARPELSVSSRDAAGVVVELRDDALIVDAADHGQAGVSVTCRFRTEPESGLILGSISVRCASEMTLASVRFPLLPVR